MPDRVRRLDADTLLELFGAAPSPALIERLHDEIASTIAQLRLARAAGERVSAPPRVAGATLADWLSAEDLAALIAELAP